MSAPNVGLDEGQFRARLADVKEAIDAYGRSDVSIVAVTKGFDRSAIDLAVAHGLTTIGENYAQELIDKAEAITTQNVEAHFIGRLQRNKVRKVAPLVSLWQSVARPEILVEIAKRVEQPRTLIQVRAVPDPTKDGIDPADLESMLALADENGVAVEGLMTIGVLGDAEATKRAFEELGTLADTYGLAQRSMGMSGDYRDALASGATMLRLGSLLFGPRPVR